MLNSLKVKRFENNINNKLKEAQELYKNHADCVVCEYCGKLLLKKESSVVYDFATKKLEYSHEECWKANNTIGDKIVPLNEN